MREINLAEWKEFIVNNFENNGFYEISELYRLYTGCYKNLFIDWAWNKYFFNHAPKVIDQHRMLELFCFTQRNMFINFCHNLIRNTAKDLLDKATVQ